MQTPFEDGKVPRDIVGSDWFSADVIRNKLYLPKVLGVGGHTTDFLLKQDDIHPLGHLEQPMCLLWFCIHTDVAEA